MRSWEGVCLYMHGKTEYRWRVKDCYWCVWIRGRVAV